MMKVTLVISSLQAGGAERVMSIIANYWADRGWNITLLTFDDGNNPPFYELDPRIVYIPLGIASSSPNILMAIGNNLTRLKYLRAAIRDRQPDAVISFIETTNIITLLATRKLNIPVIVSERSVPGVNPIRKLWKSLRWLTYRFSDRLVVQTKKALNYFSYLSPSQIAIIPNPVLVPIFDKDRDDRAFHIGSSSWVIAMGRLGVEKGYDLLLKAFAQARKLHSEWNLAILGEGPLRLELESLRDRLGLCNCVHFLGTVKNPYQFLQQADIFVMSSRFEGFPNALCEAMACGLPVISTDCPSGPGEIIRNGIDGILVPNEDVSALAAAMERLMSDASERQRLAARAPEVTERFSLEKVMNMWEKLLVEVIAEK